MNLEVALKDAQSYWNIGSIGDVWGQLQRVRLVTGANPNRHLSRPHQSASVTAAMGV